MPFSRGSSRPRDRTLVSCVSCIGRWILYHSRHLGSPSFFSAQCSLQAALPLLSPLLGHIHPHSWALSPTILLSGSCLNLPVETLYPIAHWSVPPRPVGSTCPRCPPQPAPPLALHSAADDTSLPLVTQARSCPPDFHYMWLLTTPHLLDLSSGSRLLPSSPLPSFSWYHFLLGCDHTLPYHVPSQVHPLSHYWGDLSRA